MNREVAVAIFHDREDIVVQIRDENSKLRAKYGFFGGGIEDKETPTEAVTRELKEELRYEPKEINFWTEHFFSTDSASYKLYAFLSPITNELLSSQVYEGIGMEKMRLNDAISGGDFSKGDTDLLIKFRKHLSQF